MNTVKKGDLLEDQIYQTLKDLLEKGELFVSAKNSRIYQKKGYFSRDRQSDIIFDIVIEVYREGAKDFSMLVVFEIKNYEKKVPVDDVEEFDSKINQVGVHNTKAIIISKSGFQEGAFNLALSKKMGLARVSGEQSIEWIAERKDIAGWHGNYEFIAGQLTGEIMNRTGFFGVNDCLSFSSLGGYLHQIDILENYVISESKLSIPFISPEEIDQRIQILDLVDCYDGQSLNVDRFCEKISSYYDVAFDFTQALDFGVLGKINFDPLVIYVTSALSAEINRWRFTLVHEVAHLILHYYLLRKFYSERKDDVSLFDSEKGVTNEVTQRIEHQANLMAGQILLPIGLFGEFILKYFKAKGIHRNHMFVDAQPCNQSAMISLLNEIEKRFVVSKEVGKIRLKQLGLLTEQYQPNLRSQLWINGYY